MANAWYSTGLKAFADGDVDWLSDNIKFVLVDGALHTPNTSTHDFLDDVASGARVATSGNLASKTSTGGVLDAADITFSAVAAGGACEYLICYKDSGAAATSQLLFLIDTATNLPVTPNGGDIAVVFDSGANKIAAL
jgi:hypothetical protein